MPINQNNCFSPVRTVFYCCVFPPMQISSHATLHEDSLNFYLTTYFKLQFHWALYLWASIHKFLKAEFKPIIPWKTRQTQSAEDVRQIRIYTVRRGLAEESMGVLWLRTVESCVPFKEAAGMLPLRDQKLNQGSQVTMNLKLPTGSSVCQTCEVYSYKETGLTVVHLTQKEKSQE